MSTSPKDSPTFGPGLSAEVVFLVDSRRNVTRVPLDAIRWVHERGYVAVYDPASDETARDNGAGKRSSSASATCNTPKS